MAILGAFVFHLSLLFSTIFTAEAQRRQSYVTPGSSLMPTGTNTSWLSPSGMYAFGFYPQANGYAVGVFVAGILQRTVVWTANREKLPLSSNATLHFTTEGRLVVDQTQSRKIYITPRNIYAVSAEMQDSGNFVLYDSDQMIVWQSFDNPTDTLLAGQHLLAPKALFSSVSEADQSIGIFRLNLQNDGNMVQYPVGTPDTAPYSYWSSFTDGAGANVTLNLGEDGFLFMLNSSRSFIRNITQGGYSSDDIYRMKIDVDGIFRVYSHNLSRRANWSVIWSSTTNKCVPKGLCGLNGYCVTMNDVARCTCLPGFDFVNPEIWSLGCERNYTAESCKKGDLSISYDMRKFDFTEWEDDVYFVPQVSTQEECTAACLKDCNCEAALFSDQQCKMQRLPIRYIQTTGSNSNSAFIKVGALAVNGDPNNPLVQLKKTQRRDILIVGISLVSFAIFVLVLSAVLLYRNQIWAYQKVSDNVNVQLIEGVAPKTFSYAELEQMTNGFSEEVGRGSFGIVYKGTIESSSSSLLVAVKKLKEEPSVQWEREFQTEIKVIGRTHHRNLVRLLGYCHDGPARLLVFEFMTKGSLEDILFGPSETKPCWEERISMAVDIARGILYLHEECETQIILCDIKPQNILMNEYGCAKIADFGLAKLLERDQTRTYTGIRGTRGYVAPEWQKKLPITVKADVYSFGIVLLEILCCRRNVDFSRSDDEAVLEEWAFQCLERDELRKLVGDENLDKRRLDMMIKIALWCVQGEPSLRPSMKKVLLMLEGTVDIPLPPNPTSFLSAI